MGHGVVQTEAEVFWYLNLSEEQKHACEQLRTLLEGEQLLAPGYDDDFTLLRFLKARQWDVTKAHSMFRHMVLWRRENKIDDMYPDFEYPELEHIKDLYPHFYHKTDKFGRPLYIELTGRMQSGKMVEHTTTHRFLDYHIFCWERFEKKLLPACSRRAGKPVITSCVIIDLYGLSMKNFTLTTKNLLTHIAKIDQDYYPEHLGQMFFINAPMVFRAIWACVNPLLEDRTRKKIQILGADYHAVLRQYIDDDNLPVMFGGNSVVEEMIGIGAGPWQEEEKAEEKAAAVAAVTLADIKAQGADADIIHSLAAVQQVVVTAAV